MKINFSNHTKKGMVIIMEKELLENEEIIEKSEEVIEETVEAVVEEATEEVPVEEPVEEPAEETPGDDAVAHVEEEIQVSEVPEAENYVEEREDPFKLREEANSIKEKKSFKEIWNKASALILLVAFGIPLAIIAYILIVFFLM